MTPAAVSARSPGMSNCTSSASRRVPGEAGQPTPEGMHRDGVDWVLVLMVRRENIKSGETTIYDLAEAPARQLHPDPAARCRAGR